MAERALNLRVENDRLTAEITALRAQNDLWQQNTRAKFDAMCAMRNDINEHLPMPSLESDLLEGPEVSVFCAVVAEAVIAAVTGLRARAEKAEALRAVMAQALSDPRLAGGPKPGEGK